jgi:hypothetical protein
VQTPNKNTSRAVILSNSHLKGCTKRINNYLIDKFRTYGGFKPGALAKEILRQTSSGLVELEET